MLRSVSPKGSAEAARRSSRKKKKGDRHVIKLHRAFRVLDADHSGEIDFEEFVEVCESQDRVAVLKLFELIDEDHGGSIDEDELVHALQHNKEARTLAARFPPLQRLVGMSREERRQRARSRRKASKRKSARRMSRKKPRNASTRKQSKARPPDEVDDLTAGDEDTMSAALRDVREQQRQRTKEIIKEKKQNETTKGGDDAPAEKPALHRKRSATIKLKGANSKALSDELKRKMGGNQRKLIITNIQIYNTHSAARNMNGTHHWQA